MADEESNFEKLLNDALSRLLSDEPFNSLKGYEIQNANLRIIESFKFFTSFNDFNQNENLIAYFYAYSLLNTSIAYDRFMDVFQNWSGHQKITQNESLKMISLGGGPGTDMIGFCSALQKRLPNSIRCIDFNIVEKINNWKTVGRVIENLIPRGNYGSISDIFRSKIINISYIQADVTQDPMTQKDYFQKLEESDVVLLVRFLDLFNVDREKIIENILKAMKPGALLMIIDSNSKVHEYDSVKNSIIYQKELEYFTLKIEPEEKFGIKPRKGSKANLIYILENKP